ncbi:recombinase family protein [Mixta sp. Marseille-Q2659]|uniref:recombinase family protein n=1 Tax=Mixta sp. Marseille-Q2659 TaxID=2736607 RepID=UPI0023B8ADB5|nr:recombinase family protein [Mixta sp. Marseille-Q2659]
MKIRDAVGYVRFSSAIQEQGTSVRRQRKMIDDWCKVRPEVTLHNVYTDLGKSAWNTSKHDERKEFLSMIDHRKRELFPKPVYLLVEDASRLSRLDFNEAVAQMNMLIKLGFVVVFLASDKIYNSTNFKQLGDHISFLVEAEAHNKASEQKSYHSRKNWKQLRDDAILTGKLISKSCARWVVPVATGTGELNAAGRKTTFIFNEHAETVRRVFEMRLAGKSMNSIAAILNAEGVKTLTGKNKGWNQTSVHGILNNRAAIGDYVPSKKTVNLAEADIIPGYYPMIAGLTRAMFQTVQSMREGKGRVSESENPTNVNLFKGLLKCLCGGAIISSSVTPKRYGYYTCSMYRLKRCSCFTEYPEGSGKGRRNKGNAISRLLVDEAITKGILYNLPLLLSGSNSDNHQLNDLMAEHEQLEHELNMLEDNMSQMKASPRMIKRYEEKEIELIAKQEEIDRIRSRILTSVNVETADKLDLSKREGRIELNLIAKKYISELRLDMKHKTCDIALHNGYRFLNYPLDREDFNGASWINFFLMLGEREYRFTGKENLTSGLPGRLEPYRVVEGKPVQAGKGYDDKWPEVESDYPTPLE